MTGSSEPTRGAGDRWLAGARVDGVRFAHRETVRIVLGRHTGELGTVALLLSLDADPLFLVELASGRDVRVRQSALQAVD
jgi:hypothetical protein